MILFILGVIGLTHIIVDSEISEAPHEWAEVNWPWLSRMMDCYQCCGWWCGLLLGPLLSWNPLMWFVAGCAGSFLAQFGWLMLDSLEQYATQGSRK